MAVAQVDQAQHIGISLALLRVGSIGFIQLLSCHQGIGHISESRLHRRFVVHDFRLLHDFGVIQVGHIAAPIENRQIDAGRKCPSAVAAFKQTAQLGGAGADHAGEADAGKKCRPRRADIGIGSFQRKFGRADIGAVEQHLRRQTGRQLLDGKLAAQRQAGGQIGRQRLVQQHRHGIARLLTRLHGAGVIGLSRFNQGFLLAQIHRRNHAGTVAQLRELIGLLARLQHPLRQGHTLFGIALVEIGFGHR